MTTGISRAPTRGGGGPRHRRGLCRRELEALASSDAYPHDGSAARTLESIQTHLSYVFLSAERVYKFRKAVDLEFVRFTTRDERNADCLREVALNRRLAPDVYLGVAPLLTADPGVRIGPLAQHLSADAPNAEHCVVMRRLPAGGDALSLLQRGRLGERQIDRLARLVARFHVRSALGVPAPFTADAWRARCTAPVRANLDALARTPPSVAPREVLDPLRAACLDFERGHADRFERRRAAGRAVDGHGDLHLQHVWYEGASADPVVIDCLEFSPSLRRIDAASDVAFLAMDLTYRGASALAARFLRVYAAESDDFDLYALADYFISYRAAVRAKVAALVACDAEIAAEQRERAGQSAGRHLSLAQRSLAPRSRGRLVLVTGVVGSGKSTVAAALADDLEGVVISSDRVRKHMLGLPPEARAGADAYGARQKARVYEGLLARAVSVVDSGRAAILDATFAARRERARALAWAHDRGVPAFLVQTRCEPEVAIARLAQRAREGGDASDADAALYRASAAAFEAPDEWPGDAQITLITDGPTWRSELRDSANARLRGV